MPAPTVLGFRVLGWLFGIVGVATAIVLGLVSSNDATVALAVESATRHVLTFGVPAAMAIVAFRAVSGTRLRLIATITGAAWAGALVGERFCANVTRSVDACGMTHHSVTAWLPAMITVFLLRTVGLIGLVSLPLFALRRRIVDRWPFYAAAALVTLDVVQGFRFVRMRVVVASFWEASAPMLVACGLLAYGFLTVARALREESFDERAERLPPVFASIFRAPEERAAFIGPIRMATDLVAALAVVTLVASASPFADSLSFRGDVPPAGSDTCVLVAALAGALIYLRRCSPETSFGPLAAAVAATGTAVLSAYTHSARFGSVTLFIVAAGIAGLVVLAPRAREGAARTMRRWAVSVAAAGVMIGSAGFFALTATTAIGEPILARLAKVMAVGFAIASARAATKLELGARVELAAEEREP